MAKKTGCCTPGKTRTLWAALCVVSCLCACQGPEDVSRTAQFSATDGEEYILDVYMLAEWAGHIIPQKEKFQINLKASVDKAGVLSVQDAETGRILTDVFALSDDNKDLVFRPYGKDDTDELSKITYRCTHIGEPDSLDGQYTCETYRTGAAEIKKLWDYIKTHSQAAGDHPQLIIGSGDNFGVSQVVATTYGDYPTVQMMNALGVNADTFGNHTFDFSLTEIQGFINSAKFPFVISNFINLPNNLEKTTPYVVFEIPSTKDSEKALNVAVVGAFDGNAMEIISRGHFGTITIDNYCPIIQALEEAYNKNARAFIILSHVFSDQVSIQRFFNGLFSLDEAFYRHLVEAPTVNSEDYPCRSHLIITEDMLDSTSGVDKEKQAELLRIKLHQEIYDNILMIHGEATHSPFMLGMIPGTDEATLCSVTNPKDPGTLDQGYFVYNQDGCISDVDVQKDVMSLFTSHSRFPTNNPNIPIVYSAFEDDLTYLNFPSFEYTEEGLAGLTDIHPLWFMDLPRRSVAAARAMFRITRRDDNPNATYHQRENTAAAYRSDMINYKLMPVFGEPFEKQIFSSDICENILFDRKDNAVPQSCQTYYRAYQDYAQEIENSQDQASASLEPPSYMDCVTDMLSAEGTLRDFQEIWTCMYNVTANQVCNFGKYAINNEHKDKEIRKFSTFLTNFVTDTSLRILNARYPNNPVDFVYYNAGTTREASDLTSIDSDFFSTSLPYDNKISSVNVTVNDLVDMLNNGLNVSISGGFPAIAGFKVSYTAGDNIKRYIKEVWQYHLDTKTHSLLYLKDVAVNDCILGAQTIKGEEKTCIYGKYTEIADNQVTVELSDRLVLGHPFASTTSFTLPGSDTIKKLAITNYMVTGGDNFPDQSGKQSLTELSPSLNDDLKHVFSQDSALCTLDTGDSDLDLDLEALLATNMIKRIYFISKDDSENGKVGEAGFASDYPHNICIPTQSALASELTADGILEEGTCHYTTQ